MQDTAIQKKKVYGKIRWVGRIEIIETKIGKPNEPSQREKTKK